MFCSELRLEFDDCVLKDAEMKLLLDVEDERI